MNYKYRIGETVYLITDTDQLPRLITGILLRNEGIYYYLSCGTIETSHTEIEISETKDYTK